MLKKILFIIGSLFVLWGNFAEAKMRCVVLDVGEGQAVMLQRGTSAILIDTGHFGKSYAVIDALERYGVIHLEKVILTHLHPDHASGIFTLAHHFPEVEIYESGHRVNPKSSVDSVRWVVEQLDSKEWNVVKIDQKIPLVWRGVNIDFLWPKRIQGDSLNRMSLVLNIRYGAKNIVVMGDADLYVEEQIMKKKFSTGDVELLVVGHHGAIDATGDIFLDKLSPKHAVISVNKDNIRNYPDRTVIERIRSRKIPLHITATDGDFEIVIE